MIRFEPEQPQRLRVRRGQVLTLDQLDQLLDVRVVDFERTVTRLIKTFRSKELGLDIPAGERGVPLQPADSKVTWVRLYEAQVNRLPRMDRAQEFAMARRYEFLTQRLQAAFVSAGVDSDQVKPLLASGLGWRDRLPVRAKPDAVREVGRAYADWEALRNCYVEGALYMVLGCVLRYRNLGVDAADLIQEGSASLFQAIDGFDWRRDVRFKTYAQYWIHQAILKTLYNASRTVRLPVWVQKALTKIRRVRDESQKLTGEELSDEMVGQRLGLTGERVRELTGARRYTVSLDAEVGGDDGASLGQLLSDDRAVPVSDSLDDGDLSASLEQAMADLPSRELMILQRRFGLGGKDPETLGEIASDLGITAERVRQLQKAALGRLQRPSKVRMLKAYAG